MRSIFVLFIALSLLLSGCGTLEIWLETSPPEIPDVPLGPGAGGQPTAEPGLSLSSSSEEIRRAMLESAANWLSIWMDGTISHPAMDGTNQMVPDLHEQVWIDQTTTRFRILTGMPNGNVQTFKASDGLSILEIDLQTGRSQSTLLPEFAKVKQFVPTLEPGQVYPQPLWGQMGSPISLLAFPSDFAQSEGTFRPLAMETVAGREALVAEWTYSTNDLPSWRVWLDTETAVILKMQTFGKEGSGVVQSETVVNQIRYDDVFANFLFRAPASLPQFSDVTGRPLTESEPAPTTSSDPDPLREVYIFAFDPSAGNENIQLMRVRGSCVAGFIPCPQAESIETPFDLKFNLMPLIWAPAGDAAAFSHPISEDGSRSALFLFEPGERSWLQLAEFNYIDPPYWSPDGSWLAFRVQDGAGGDEIYAVRRDGSQLTNLSANENLPRDGQPYVLNGWIGNNAILRGRGDQMVYLVEIEDGLVKPLFETPWAKSDFVPSPDGYFLAYADMSGPSTILKLLTPDGNTTRELADLQNASIYPIVWSPDGKSLAFASMTGNPADGQNVYVVNPGANSLQQVYRSSSATINHLAFSPDGKHLLFQDDDAAGRHIFVIDLATLEQRMLQVPNLPLDWWWLMPSWRN